MNGKIPERLNVLFVGNSFSLNTSRFLPKIAFDRGVKEVKIGVLYVGGCSIKSHYEFAMEDKKIGRVKSLSKKKITERLIEHMLNPQEEYYQPRLRNAAYSCLNK